MYDIIPYVWMYDVWSQQPASHTKEDELYWLKHVNVFVYATELPDSIEEIYN